MNEGATSPDDAGDVTVGEFLQDLLDRGNRCWSQGDVRNAIRNYDSALKSFLELQGVAPLRPIFQTIWANKAIAHQQLGETARSNEAAMIANALLVADPGLGPA